MRRLYEIKEIHLLMQLLLDEEESKILTYLKIIPFHSFKRSTQIRLDS